MSDNKRNQFFYGWIIVLACMLLSGATTGVISYTAGLFVKPVTEAFCINRADFALYSTISTLFTMVILPFVGGFYKKYPFKAVMLCGILCGAAALLLFSVAANIYVFYGAALLIGLCLALSSAIPVVSLISNWFVDKRGVATAIAFAGSGVATMFVSTPITRLIESAGWRASYRILALIFAAITVPIVLFVIRQTPEEMGCVALGRKTVDADAAAAPAAGFTKNQALHTKAFWVFAAAIFLISLTSNGSQQHLIPHWSDIGMDAVTASTLYSVCLGVGVGAKPLLGVVYDKLGVRKASVIVCCVGFCSFAALFLCRAPSVAWLSAVLFGLATSMQIVPPTYMTNKLFGDKDYSSIYGIITTIYYCGVSVGTPLSAFVFDTTGTYSPVWILYALFIVITVVLMLTADTLSKKSFVEILGRERE